MRTTIILLALVLTACGKSHQGETANNAADAFSVSTHCQLQSVGPAPGYGPEISLNTYLCSQYRPSCFIQVLWGGAAFNQVPHIVSNTCPANPAQSQVPI